MSDIEETKSRKPRLLPFLDVDTIDIPWWALIILLFFILISYVIATKPNYTDAFNFLIEGVRLTITVTLISFVIALFLGLIAGLGRLSRNVVFRTLSTLYVEVVRGIPLLVQIIYFAFVLAPALLGLLNGLGNLILNYLAIGPLTNLGYSLANMHIQDIDMTVRASLGLAFGYGAYEAEVFRAGIESIARGQSEAARSLGMTTGQTMRYVILPQAIRRVLPPFGNDFIAMLKDSSLISVLAVRELTHLGKLNRARTFRTFETWNTVAFLYLILTVSLSLLVKLLERRMAFEE
ncbi:MAG: amino acid ABC transporter permease [Anaerolineaceae bacterium]|nr:MAG: amino acid ABC transporter permease [Anaerolineaceae bacterium]